MGSSLNLGGQEILLIYGVNVLLPLYDRILTYRVM